MGKSKLKKERDKKIKDDNETKGKTESIRGRNQPGSFSPVKGVVVARKCKYCQHHEIGIKTKRGYLPLKPGMKIEVIED